MLVSVFRLLRVAALAVWWLPGAGRSVSAQEPAVAAASFSGAETDVITQLDQSGADPQSRLAAWAQEKEFPAAELIRLLQHPTLKVRSAALEWLEFKAGTDFGFDPFLPRGEAAKASLTAWEDWLKTQNSAKTDAVPDKAGSMGEERFAIVLSGLLASQVELRERSWQTLAAEGMGMAGRLELWLSGQPDLPEGARARIKEAQYRMVLVTVARTEAAVLARDLVFGTRQVKLEAMSRLKEMGPVVTPVLAEFLPDPDSLIRETAVECLLKAGGKNATSLVRPRLEVEQDENVLHAIVRGCEDDSAASLKILASFTRHANEDLAVAALQALGRLKAAAESDRVLEGLKDPRWRVRTAALEAAGAMKLKKAGPLVMEALGDADAFVRSSAVQAAGAIELTKAIPTLEDLAVRDPALLGTVTEALITMNRTVGGRLLEAAMKAPGEHTLAMVQVIVRKEKELKVLVTLARHPDGDVATAAIHGLAKTSPQEASYRQLVREALQRSTGEKAINLMEALDTSKMGSGTPDPKAEAELAERRALVERFRTTPGQVSETTTEAVTQNPEVTELYMLAGAPAVPEVASAAAPVEDWTTQYLANETTWEDPELSALLEKFLRDPADEPAAVVAARRLVVAGHAEACAFLVPRLAGMPVHDRVEIAKSLYQGTAAPAKMELLRPLLADEALTVRQAALNSVLEHAEDSAPFAAVLFEVLDQPRSVLAPHELVHMYSLTSMDDAEAKALARKWSLKQLGSESNPVPRQVLGLVLLAAYGTAEDDSLVLDLTRSTDMWVRRAAWFSFVRRNGKMAMKEVPRAAEDVSEKVREAVSLALTAEEMPWEHWFSDRQHVLNRYTPYRSDLPKKLAPESRFLLEKLARDGSAEIRLSSMLALLSFKVEVPLPALTDTLKAAAVTEEQRARVANFLENNYERLGGAGRVLLRFADLENVSSTKLPAIEKKFQTAPEAGLFTSFSALAGLEGKPGEAAVEPVPAGTKTGAESASESAAPAALQETVQLVFFYKPGCQECSRVRNDLEKLRRDLPWLEVAEWSVESAEGAERNQLLARRRNVDSGLVLVTPAVYTQAGVLIRDGVEAGPIRSLVERSRELPAEPGWDEMPAAEREEAAREIESRYANFGLGWVVLAGLLDGINPCAFATIIFFISWLRVARRSPREILMVGSAFVLAVFLAYFLVGLGLSRVLVQIRGWEGARLWLNRLLALTALILALLSLRDAIRAWRGNLEDMSLQLPDGIKARIRSTIREGARQRHFVVAAFVTGVVISFLELACTGQVYLPTIAYMMEQGRLSAVGWLLIYNLAFVLPLIIIFVLAYFGLGSESLMNFQKKHTALVRLGTALLFLILFLVLILSGSVG